MYNYKTLILPIIGFLTLAIQVIFKVQIGPDVQAQLAQQIGDLVALGVVIYGIFKNHQLPPNTPQTPTAPTDSGVSQS